MFYALNTAIAFCVGQLIHDQVPVFAGGAAHEQDHCVTKVSEVILLVDLVLVHNLTEQIETECCINEQKNTHQTHDIGNLGQDIHDRINEEANGN